MSIARSIVEVMTIMRFVVPNQKIMSEKILLNFYLQFYDDCGILNNALICGCSSVAELQPSKLAMWVRFPSPAPFVYMWRTHVLAGVRAASILRQ